MAQIKAVLFGTGNMGQVIAKYLHEKGVEITGVVSRTHVGEDIGEVSLIGKATGVMISDDVDKVLASVEADIAVHAACSSLAELYPDANLCLQRGLNLISITEGAFYPWTYDPDMTAELDALSKQHGVTLSATGVQDAFWVNAIACLSGVCHKIDSVEIQASADFGKLGPAVLQYFPLGLTPEQFMANAPPADAKPPASTIGTSFEALINKLRMNIKKIEGGLDLVLARTNIECVALNKTIEVGQISGLTEIISMETQEGATFSANFSAKLFEPGDEEHYVWDIKGEPNIHLQQNHVPSVEITCATCVNRIPDVMNASPGFITAEKLDAPYFRSQSLEKYVTK
jgi:2,4-diaminopentanoate dehydrogenase